VVLPLTLALIAIALGATTLHQNEMRDLIAQRDERTVREAANNLAERVSHQAQLAQAVAELVQAGVPLAAAQQRLGASTGSFEILSDASLTSLARSSPAGKRNAAADQPTLIARTSWARSSIGNVGSSSLPLGRRRR
jgi:hypothetical protein